MRCCQQHFYWKPSAYVELHQPGSWLKAFAILYRRLRAVIQERLAFAVLTDHCALLSSAPVLAEDAWCGDQGRAKEEHAHDDESEDPLKRDDLGGELSESKG